VRPGKQPAGKQPAGPVWRDYLKVAKPTGPTRGWECIRWVEAHCVFTNDRWIGKPFRLLPWQKYVILALFTVGADGLRVARWALVGIAKKNGKTELAAALALFFAFGPSGPDGEPEPAALVVCAAGNDDQADLVFGAARRMCELSPTLSQVTEVYEAEIVCPSLPGSKVRRVAAAAKATSSTLDGPNIYVVVCDELHCWEGSRAEMVWDTLTNGGVTRRQPLVLQITTAGFERDSVCGRQYDYGLSVAHGEVDDPAFLFWWVEPPEGADHTDPAVIEASNPSFGLIMGLPFYLDQLTKKTEAVFRRFFLNQWTEAEETWLGHGTWEALAVPRFTLDRHRPAWTGTDAATRHDSTAHVVAQWHDCTAACPGWKEGLDDGRAVDGAVRKLRLRAAVWERPMDPRTRKPLDGWRLPIAEVEQRLRSWWRLLGEELQSCGYDPALFERSAQALEAEGLPMEEYPQSDARMVPACQRLYQLAMESLIEHDGDPVFARHMRNAVAVQTRGGDGGWRLSKGKSKARKMDAAIAAAIAVALATAELDVGGDDFASPSAEQIDAAPDLFRSGERLSL